MSGDTDGHDAIVAGAGSAGLSAAAALQSRGFETVVLERSDAVGARWRSRYEELRLNSWRVMSNLQGYRMPRSCGRYPGRDDFVAYLDRYLAHQQLRVLFKTGLVRVERAGDLWWRLHTSAGAMFARYVVIATGWDAVPVLPDWPGRESFAAELIHSSDFCGARTYRGREVLVVGCGNSGIDDGFIAALKQGRTQIVAEVAGLDGPEVVLADGSRLRPEAVICATGYRRGLEPLVGHLGVLRPDGVPFSYRGAPEHPAAPNLFFAGMWGQFSGEIRLGPIHARRIARDAARRRAHRNNQQQRPAGAPENRHTPSRPPH